MKFTKLALAAVLSSGMTSVVVVAPAVAQKKGKEDKNAGPKLSDAVRKPLAAAQTALSNLTKTRTATVNVVERNGKAALL